MNSKSKNICFIGMSGVGKTVWAKKLEENGVKRISCDDLIIEDILDQKATEVDPIRALGDWLGYPWDEGFQEREKIYIDSETKHMQNILETEHQEPTIIDTAGSVIYCPDEILAALQEKYLVVYLSLTPERKLELTNDYLKDPRPIIWNKTFIDIHEKEHFSELFKYEYLALTDSREVLYKQYSDIEIDSNQLDSFDNADQLLEEIRTQSLRSMMGDLKKITKQIVRFRDQRDWKQFHKPKDMIISLSLEAAELVELVQWKDNQEFLDHLEENREAIGDELADLLYWVLLISHDLDIDLAKAFEKKMLKNEDKYPIEKAKGSSAKYND